MSNSYNIDKDESSSLAIIKINGSLDEDFRFDEMIFEKIKNYRFNFNDLTSINSCGIREWLLYLSKLEKNVTITYEKCPAFLIEQINTVEGLLPVNAQVESFYCPYYSESTDKEFQKLYNVSDILEGKAPKLEIDGVIYEFDSVEIQFFKFLNKDNNDT
jgi:hypothetical protein